MILESSQIHFSKCVGAESLYVQKKWQLLTNPFGQLSFVSQREVESVDRPAGDWFNALNLHQGHEIALRKETDAHDYTILEESIRHKFFLMIAGSLSFAMEERMKHNLLTQIIQVLVFTDYLPRVVYWLKILNGLA